MLNGQSANEPSSIELRRAGWFTAVLIVINLVEDGWSGRPSPLLHQFILLPFAAMFFWSLTRLLYTPKSGSSPRWTTHRALLLCLIFELCFVLVYPYEVHHFASVGYQVRPVLAAVLLIPALLALVLAATGKLKPSTTLAATFYAYAAGLILSIRSFPLTYLRSDMLPVILWADQNLLHHVDPYIPMHVADRLYAFPYLPGMLLAFLPFVAAHMDIRAGCLAYSLAIAAVVWFASRPDRRLHTTALLALFLLCPFLQYRHELYLQPHWFTMVLAFALMQRRRFLWGAFVFGLSMALYQFSWIMFPFMLLNALRRRGWLEVLKVAAMGAAGSLLIVGPFLRSASQRIANNTVGQWGHLSSKAHAPGDPINLSYWATYFVHVDQLLKLQAVLMVVIFLICFARKGCVSLADTLRWMLIAVTVFVLFNSLVDGYFFLMLLVIMLAYTCIANGWWTEPEPNPEHSTAT